MVISPFPFSKHGAAIVLLTFNACPPVIKLGYHSYSVQHSQIIIFVAHPLPTSLCVVVFDTPTPPTE